jgi:hypothetical protein
MMEAAASLTFDSKKRQRQARRVGSIDHAAGQDAGVIVIRDYPGCGHLDIEKAIFPFDCC